MGNLGVRPVVGNLGVRPVAGIRLAGTVDALSNVTTATFDAAGNQLSQRDPNSIGWNATYDARNRQITMADTQEQAEGKNRQRELLGSERR